MTETVESNTPEWNQEAKMCVFVCTFIRSCVFMFVCGCECERVCVCVWM